MLCVRWAALVRWQTAAVRRDGCSGVGRRPRSVVSRVACGSAPSVMFRSKETFGHPVHCDRLASDRVRLDRLRGCGRTAGRTARPCYERTNERTKGIAFFWIEEHACIVHDVSRRETSPASPPTSSLTFKARCARRERWRRCAELVSADFTAHSRRAPGLFIVCLFHQ